MKTPINTILKNLITTSVTAFLFVGGQFAATPAPVDYATVQVISSNDSPSVIAEKAAKVLPRAYQSDWMRLERTFFLHFGVNTFNGVEWGTGREEPSIFNPVISVLPAAIADERK